MDFLAIAKARQSCRKYDTERKVEPEKLDADGAMDLLERSVKLDLFIAGADKENNKPVQGELAITFADSFKDL